MAIAGHVDCDLISSWLGYAVFNLNQCFPLQWFRIGVNISNFPGSISAVGFHLGLGGEFSVYLFHLPLK